MRFTVKIEFAGSKGLKLPFSYRIFFVSLIKNALKSNAEGQDIYNKYYSEKGKNISKPFTFSVYIPGVRNIKENGISYFKSKEHYVNFFFSSSDINFLNCVYNGLLKPNTKLSILGMPLELKYLNLKRDLVIDSNSLVFRTLSPVIVRKIDIYGKNKLRNLCFYYNEDGD